MPYFLGFSKFSSYLNKSGTGDVHTTTWSDREFFGNQWSESHTNSLGHKSIYRYYWHLMSHLGQIQYTKSEHNAVEHWQFHETFCREGHTLLMGLKEITFLSVYHENVYLERTGMSW